MSESTEVATADTRATSLAVGSRGVEIRTFDEAWRFSVAVARSGLAPRSFQTPEAILIAIQHGAELGLAPMQALSTIAVINGRPTIWGDGAKALIEASPLCEWIEETVYGIGDSMVATCKAKRVGRPQPTVRTFSVNDAKQAGLWNNKGPWVQYPKRMLQMRARGFALRDQFADVLSGIAIAEEWRDVEPAGLQNGDETPAQDLDDLAAELGDEPAADDGPPTTQELIESGELEPVAAAEDPGVGRLFDDPAGSYGEGH